MIANIMLGASRYPVLYLYKESGGWVRRGSGVGLGGRAYLNPDSHRSFYHLFHYPRSPLRTSQPCNMQVSRPPIWYFPDIGFKAYVGGGTLLQTPNYFLNLAGRVPQNPKPKTHTKKTQP